MPLETADTIGLTIAHTSDLHIGARTSRDGELHTLRAVLDASGEAGARALILAGDIFDNNRVPQTTVAQAIEMLEGAALEVVILPGNHDPAMADAIYHQRELHGLDHVHIFGVTHDQSIHLEALDLEMHGVPHTDYADMPALVSPRERSLRWQVVVAHGHWVRGPQDAHRGWLLHDDDLAALGADYIALGHWDLPQPAGDERALAYYSGSPEIAKTVNIVRFSDAGVQVERFPLRLD
jgi:DNA repair exonuclease SbcCD nuclease subunit